MMRKSIDPKILTAILDEAAWAPSAENTQPWRVENADAGLRIGLDHSRVNPFFDPDGRMARMAVGAFVETIAIAATACGLRAKAEVHQDSLCRDLLVTVEFESSTDAIDPLYRCIRQRWTNRFPYEIRRRLNENVVDKLRSAGSGSGINMSFLTSGEKIRDAARIMGAFDVIRFSMPSEIRNLITAIRTAPEERNLLNGLNLPSLGLGKADQLALLAVRQLHLTSLLSAGPAPYALAQNTLKTVPDSSALMMLTADARRGETPFAWGRITQRIWLTAVSEALAVQPLYAPVHYSYLVSRFYTPLGPSRTTLINNNRKKWLSLFGAGADETLVMIFRLGYSKRERIASARQVVMLKDDTQTQFAPSVQEKEALLHE